MDRLHELAERLEEEHGAVTDAEQQAALDRIAAAIGGRHDEQRSRSDGVHRHVFSTRERKSTVNT